MHLGCEAHFGLWRRYFCVVPCSLDGKLYEVGAAEVCHIDGTDYPSGTPREDTDIWLSEWFYIEDVPLLDPVRPRLPPFSSEPPKKHYCWRPRSAVQEDDADTVKLAAQVK
jgi:hypothetical protein